MSRERANDLLEAQVREARERGDFDHLPTRGKPLVLDDLDHLPVEQRLEALLLRTTGEVSAEVALVREIRAGRQLLDASANDDERQRLRAELQDKVDQLQKLLKSR